MKYVVALKRMFLDLVHFHPYLYGLVAASSKLCF
jgi:hypothetical protein